MFASEDLAKIVQHVIPSDKTNALVGTVDKNGAQLIWGWKLGVNNEWELQGTIEHTWAGDNDGQIKIIWSR